MPLMIMGSSFELLAIKDRYFKFTFLGSSIKATYADAIMGCAEQNALLAKVDATEIFQEIPSDQSMLKNSKNRTPRFLDAP